MVNAVEMLTGLVEDTGAIVSLERSIPRVNLEADILAEHVEKVVKP